MMINHLKRKVRLSNSNNRYTILFDRFASFEKLHFAIRTARVPYLFTASIDPRWRGLQCLVIYFTRTARAGVCQSTATFTSCSSSNFYKSVEWIIRTKKRKESATWTPLASMGTTRSEKKMAQLNALARLLTFDFLIREGWSTLVSAQDESNGRWKAKFLFVIINI